MFNPSSLPERTGTGGDGRVPQTTQPSVSLSYTPWSNHTNASQLGCGGEARPAVKLHPCYFLDPNECASVSRVTEVSRDFHRRIALAHIWKAGVTSGFWRTPMKIICDCISPFLWFGIHGVMNAPTKQTPSDVKQIVFFPDFCSTEVYLQGSNIATIKILSPF